MLETVVKENFRKKERDRHNDYKWVYFSEALKNRIAFFLSDKLFGKNLDIGG
jgi:hypothetical protein